MGPGTITIVYPRFNVNSDAAYSLGMQCQFFASRNSALGHGNTGVWHASRASYQAAIYDQGNRPATIRALVLGAAGYVNLRVANQAGKRAADEGAGMAS